MMMLIQRVHHRWLRAISGPSSDASPSDCAIPAMADQPTPSDLRLRAIESRAAEIINEASALPSHPAGDWCVRRDQHELIARWIPEGSVVADVSRITILGHVDRDVTLVARTIEIQGNVHTGARVVARGANARVLIHGDVAVGTTVYAIGGGAVIEFRSDMGRYAITEVAGGGAQVIRHDRPRMIGAEPTAALEEALTYARSLPLADHQRAEIERLKARAEKCRAAAARWLKPSQWLPDALQEITSQVEAVSRQNRQTTIVSLTHTGPRPLTPKGHAEMSNNTDAPDISDPNDIAMLKALRGAAFGPDATVTLPSGRVLTAQQIRELTADS